ncbi:hypothetical protein K474DRAFT_1085868 [Panus rudis PR-1116 ss-1]|nr:hypothetical protein K474DRAFT_1085868 [Panus rudis PR-1116 ss-1]
MKFSASLSSLLVLLPLLAQSVAATPLGFKGGVAGAGANNNNDNNNGAAAASASAAAASASASAAATGAATKGANGKDANNNGAKGAGAAATSAAAASSAAAATAASAASAAATATGAAAAAQSSAAAATGAAGAGGDAQTSLTLDPKVIAKGFANDGQDQPTAGQVPSLTSTNNFINFCLTQPNLPLTNGQQIKTGSCNPAPMGVIAATTNMPSSKFQFPTNGATIKANTAFTIKMAIQNLETGFFTNANENYFAAPQQVNGQGNIQGHSHVVVEALQSLTQTTPTDPTHFAFFKGLNDKAAGGVLSADVTDGLPAGVYRLASINTAANHQPALVAVAQHGSLDDMVYFTVTDDGQAAGNATAGAGNANAGGAAGNNNAGAGNATATATNAGAAASTTAAASVSASVSSAAASASSSATLNIKGSNSGARPGVQGGFAQGAQQGQQGQGQQGQGQKGQQGQQGQQGQAQQGQQGQKGANNAAQGRPPFGGFGGRFGKRSWVNREQF